MDDFQAGDEVTAPGGGSGPGAGCRGDGGVWSACRRQPCRWRWRRLRQSRGRAVPGVLLPQGALCLAAVGDSEAAVGPACVVQQH